MEMLPTEMGVYKGANDVPQPGDIQSFQEPPGSQSSRSLLGTSWWQDRSVLRATLYKTAINTAVAVFFAFATVHHVRQSTDCRANCGWQWCDGYGMLIILLTITYAGVLYFMVLKPLLGPRIHRKLVKPLQRASGQWIGSIYAKLVPLGVVVTAFAVFLYFETKDDTHRLVSLAGILALLLLSLLCSKHPTKINLRPVVMGILFQVLLGIICIRWEVGRNALSCIGDKVNTFLQYTNAGSSFVYGSVLVHEYMVFAFAALSVIYFFSLFVSMLYYLGAMQWVVLKLGWMLQSILGTTVCESIIAAGNIFLGQSESVLLVRPYLPQLTHSEMHSIMASGFATVSGTVLAAYISFGADPGHLITASVISAPAVLSVGKIIYPEVEQSQTRSDNIQMEKSSDSSLIDAACSGASAGTQLVLGIIANLIAFVSLVAFINGVLGWLGMLVGVESVTLELILGYVFRPLAYVMGVSWQDSEHVGKVIGLKTVVNEFVAYQQLGKLMELQTISSRSAVIATYAICGFANPSSIGIMIGALSAMAPNRRSAITEVSARAFLTGSIACFMTACTAGLLINDTMSSSWNRKIVQSISNVTL